MNAFSLGMFALLALASSAGAQLAPRYTVTRLNPYGDVGAAHAPGLSDNGLVAATTNAVFASAFGWAAGSLAVPSAVLEFPPPAGVAWTASAAVAVNDVGVCVGWFSTDALPFTLTRGFRFQNGASVELLGPEGTPALPTAVNRDGWIVGSTTTAAGPRAVLWRPDLVASYLGPLELAHDVNAALQIVGSVATQTLERAVLYDAGVVTDLGHLDPAGAVRARALNAHGHVVGQARAGARDVAFRWTPAGGMTALAAFATPAGQPDFAFDVDDAGRVLGIASELDLGGVAVVWSATGEMQPLSERVESLGRPFELVTATPLRINASGQIVALAFASREAVWSLLTPAELHLVPQAPAVAGAPYVVDVHGARPGRPVFLVAGGFDPAERGYRALPGGPLGISIPHPRLVARSVADASGDARLTWNVPAIAAGEELRVQAFQLATTRVSNLVYEQP